MITISQITFSVLIQRVAIESVFMGVVLLGTLFREGGDILWQWGWLQVTTEGITVLGSVAIKALLSLSMLNLLVMTTAIADLLNALIVLKMPTQLTDIKM
jgi:cobalt/nickel transport system permease protein